MLPKRLLEQLDELVGPRHRSEFIAEAVASRLAQERVRAALCEMRAWPARDPGEEEQEFEQASMEVRAERRRVSAREQWLEDNWYNQNE